ncbi:hypothetical protein [Calditerricola satsumensis]|uniref:Uncharacterized protein n=1 Tax=Calditerricola satsumensis TaxID=373054 RepID=A0A8J3F903_9BACI|nr:hypothetical protein [Calditerricola satsumensis]GGJ95240.1 hypothetical protein GCM10007043_06320 [Calditerricola satsumensis]
MQINGCRTYILTSCIIQKILSIINTLCDQEEGGQVGSWWADNERVQKGVFAADEEAVFPLLSFSGNYLPDQAVNVKNKKAP